LTDREKRHVRRVKRMACIVPGCGRRGPSIAHHCDTGHGRGKDHLKLIPVCKKHHMATDGEGRLGGQGRKEWEAEHGSEEALLARTRMILLDAVIR